MARLPRPQTRIDLALLMSHPSNLRLSNRASNRRNRYFSAASGLVTCLLALALLASGCQSTKPTVAPGATERAHHSRSPSPSPTLQLAASPTSPTLTAPLATPSSTATARDGDSGGHTDRSRRSPPCCSPA